DGGGSRRRGRRRRGRRGARTGRRGRGRVPRAGGARGEVGRVCVGVDAAGPRAHGRGRVAERRSGRRSLVVGRRAVADEVGDGREGGAAARGGATCERARVADERDLAARRRQVRRPARVGGRERRADGGGRRELHEVVAAGRDRPGERRLLPRRAGCRRVLHRPAADVDGGRAAIQELDVVVRVRGTGVAAARVDLTDDDV